MLEHSNFLTYLKFSINTKSIFKFLNYRLLILLILNLFSVSKFSVTFSISLSLLILNLFPVSKFSLTFFISLFLLIPSLFLFLIFAFFQITFQNRYQTFITTQILPFTLIKLLFLLLYWKNAKLHQMLDGADSFSFRH